MVGDGDVEKGNVHKSAWVDGLSTFCKVNCRTSSDGLANSQAKNMRSTSNEKETAVHISAILVFNGKMNIFKTTPNAEKYCERNAGIWWRRIWVVLFSFFDVQNNDKQAAPTMEMTWESGKGES